MRFKTPRIVASVAVIGAVAAGGAAFTASETVPTNLAGYGTTTVSGATLNSLNYDLSADGTTITTANLVFAQDLTGDSVGISFGSGNLASCTIGTYDSGTGTTPVTCSGLSQETDTADNVDIAVTGGTIG